MIHKMCFLMFIKECLTRLKMFLKGLTTVKDVTFLTWFHLQGKTWHHEQTDDISQKLVRFYLFSLCTNTFSLVTFYYKLIHEDVFFYINTKILFLQRDMVKKVHSDMTRYLLLQPFYCSCWWDLHTERTSRSFFIFNHHSYTRQTKRTVSVRSLTTYHPQEKKINK